MSRRLPTGGTRIDRSRPVTISVDGEPVPAFTGDTVASALLAAGRPVVGRGIYTGRPRGVVGVGSEDPTAFVQVVSGAGEPMVAATTLAVHDGLAVERLAGRGWLPPVPEAGDGGAATAGDPRHDHRHAHAEVVVVGGGRSGVRAARAAAASGGGRVLLVHDGDPGAVGPVDGVRVLSRTTATGLYGHGRVVAVERRAGGDRLHHLQAGRVVLATGARERTIAFVDNDRPGVMLAGAAAAYAHRYAVLPGERAVVWAAHDPGLRAALDLADAGVRVLAVLDVRGSMTPRLAAAFERRGVPVHLRAEVTGTEADDDGGLAGVLTTAGALEADLLAVSGGLDPAVELWSHAGGRTRWSEPAAAFVPDPATAPAGLAVEVVGAAAGAPRDGLTPPAAYFCGPVGDPASSGAADDERVFLDLHRDATLRDLRRAHGAGMTSVEHVKRFTTIGTGADQGRGAGVLSVGVLATELGRPVGEVGTTTYRPPLVPLSFGLLAGRTRGVLSDPVRLTQVHDRVSAAPMEDVGQWRRPRYFPRERPDGRPETMDEAVRREVRAVRTSAGMMDASTLGKILLQGPDAGVLLDRVYTNLFSTLAVGKVRYGVMCGPDGMVLDDGTTARLSDDTWLTSTTTGNAAVVLDALEEWHQTEWPELDVTMTSVTDQWSVVAVAGPRSRDVLAALAPDLDCSAAAFGFMEWRETTVAGLPARVMRISFSGELAYEVYVPAWWGAALWDAVAAAGAAVLPAGITPYGTETMHVLRAEKGFPIVGQDTDGTVTPHDLGMSWVVSRKKADFVGRRSLARPDTARPDRRHLVGLVPLDGRSTIVEGAQLVAHGADLAAVPVPMAGHVTSAYPTGHDGAPFALALLDSGRDRHGEVLDAVDDRVPTPVRVTAPVSYDPEGRRRDGDD